MGAINTDRTERKIVPCRRIKPAASILLEDCMTCEYHGEIILEAPSQNGRPPVENVKCNFPTLVRVGYLLA